MANTTTSNVTQAFNNYLDTRLLSRAYPYFVHTRWAQVRDIPQKNTQTIKFRKYTSLTAATTALTEGVTPNGSQLSITDITANVAQYGDFVTTTDFLSMTVVEDLHKEMVDLIGDQMGDTLDQLTRNVLIGGTTIQYASTATSLGTVASGMILNGNEVKKAVRTLGGNNAKKITEQIDPTNKFNSSPVAASYVGIISHQTHYDLKNDPEWIPVREYAESGNLLEGEVGTLDEVRFVLATTNAYVNSGVGAGSIDVHYTLILGKEAYGITRIAGNAVETVTKPLGSSGTADPLNQRATMGWKSTFVATILQQAFMVVVRHAVNS